jgi:8-hydroxy-5-deazaflavin:NADPH oxidoreductase
VRGAQPRATHAIPSDEEHAFMTKPTIAVIGGTGAEGSGLALRWAAGGYPVIIGSRDAQRAAAAAEELTALLPDTGVALQGQDNAHASAAADIIVFSVPYSAQPDILEQIVDGSQGKTVITVVVPLKPPRVSVAWQPPGGAAALEVQERLGENVKVVAAFQNVGAAHLRDLDHTMDCDILVTGDDPEAKQVAMELATAAGFFGIDAGPLANAGVVEGLTAVLIGINIRHKVRSTGIRITGIARAG